MKPARHLIEHTERKITVDAGELLHANENTPQWVRASAHMQFVCDLGLALKFNAVENYFGFHVLG